VWFNLGDRDLAIGLERAGALASGRRLTEAQAQIAAALGVSAKVLPMSDEPVRTWVLARGRWSSLQEFLIRGRGAGPVQDVRFRGTAGAAPTPEVTQAIAQARAIVIGPSNPVISIGPILALPGVREALVRSPAPVVAVSPLVAGQVLKGPTDAFLAHAGLPLSSDGIARCYEGLLDGLVADQPSGLITTFTADVLMSDPPRRRAVAEAALAFAASLSR
jgi:LPPG:FO 2-phospho-L-lactate transferase